MTVNRESISVIVIRYRNPRSKSSIVRSHDAFFVLSVTRAIVASDPQTKMYSRLRT